MLFTEAFGDPAITTERIAKALAQFVRSIVSFNAKYDEGILTVINHYSTEIQDHPTLQPFLRDQNGNPIKYNFSPEKKAR